MLEVNEYFDGKVKSIAFDSSPLPATVGVMLSGEYTFNTAAKETMTVVSGAMTIQLPDQKDWSDYQAGETFYVPANSTFKLKIAEATAYLCLYG
jgi:hypothetical protein